VPKRKAPKQEIKAFLKELKECKKLHVVDDRSDGSNMATLTEFRYIYCSS
jgi:hypothetical protein